MRCHNKRNPRQIQMLSAFRAKKAAGTVPNEAMISGISIFLENSSRNGSKNFFISEFFILHSSFFILHF